MLQNHCVNRDVNIRPMRQEDWNSVASIFLEGINTGNATFETEVPGWEKWDSSHLQECRLVAEINGEIAGWIALVPVSARKVYAGVSEISIYVAEKFRGNGIGTRLMERLIEESEKNGIWTLQAVIFPENVSSIRLHEHSGFRIVGYREKPGKMNEVWRDTILLERRSRIVGS